MWAWRAADSLAHRLSGRAACLAPTIQQIPTEKNPATSHPHRPFAAVSKPQGTATTSRTV